MENCRGCGDPTNEENIVNFMCGACNASRGLDTVADATLEKQLSLVLLTTETNPEIDIQKRIEIITAECVFGINIFKDLFAAVTDTFGGRSATTQSVLRDARVTVLKELKKEACRVGANAVVAVDLNYSEFSGGGKSMLFVVAVNTGTGTLKILIPGQALLKYSKGSPQDNAAMESLFHTLKAELVQRRTFESKVEAVASIVHYINFYNQERLHSSLNYQSPQNYEMLCA